ncbi:tautomerase family protein [Lichenibacterium dinghuense]|uniref:tautomerase family protein n=1 Tax=Lichenibacterium dinghuense TaxID=2895977 RepID=UPI001F1CFFEA|nr:tautomerase family protein [Lichenibacterium sp. 6Y81]
MTRIDLPAGRSPEYRAAFGDAVQHALYEALGVPMAERFQVIAEHGPSGLVIDPGYLDVARSAEAVSIQVSLNHGRDAENERRFFAALADAFHAAVGLRREDVVVNLVEVGREDWSFGDAETHLAWAETSLPQALPTGARNDDPLRTHLDRRRRELRLRGRHDRPAEGRARRRSESLL